MNVKPSMGDKSPLFQQVFHDRPKSVFDALLLSTGTLLLLLHEPFLESLLLGLSRLELDPHSAKPPSSLCFVEVALELFGGCPVPVIGNWRVEKSNLW